jgi:Zn-dependent protease
MFHFKLFGFPVEVQWPFWLTTVMLSGRMEANSPEALNSLLMWVLIVFVSILFHELGHVLAMRFFGDRAPRITLYAMGGLAHPTTWFSRWQSIAVSAAGPAASALLGMLGWLLMTAWVPDSLLVERAFYDWLWVNVGWTIFNLLPIMPLDGGQMTEAFFSNGNRRIPIYLSIAFASAATLFMLLNGVVFSTLFFGFLAYNSWKRLKGSPQIDFRDFGR